MTIIEFLNEKRENPFGGWSRRCRVAGVEYQVSIERGKAIRIPYKPRGENKGFHWHGTVYSNGQIIWHDRVSKSVGVRGLLAYAGIL
jgi:hypothetical protein